MRKELSSRYTWMYRWVVPGFLTVVAVAVIWQFGKLGDDAPASGSGVLLGVAIAAAAMILARILDRAKRVWLIDDKLLISDYRREVRVGLSDVAEVKSMPWFWPPRISVRFSQTTAFGAGIVFFPPLQIARPAAIVRQLQTDLGVSSQDT
jgi:hypothetical protein